MSESVDYYKFFGLENVPWCSKRVSLAIGALSGYGFSSGDISRIIHNIAAEYTGKLEEILEEGELDSFLQTAGADFYECSSGGFGSNDVEDSEGPDIAGFVDYDINLGNVVLADLMDCMEEDDFVFAAAKHFPEIHFSQLDGGALMNSTESSVENKLSRLGSIASARELWSRLYTHSTVIAEGIRRYVVDVVCYKAQYGGISSFLKVKLNPEGER